MATCDRALFWMWPMLFLILLPVLLSQQLSVPNYGPVSERLLRRLALNNLDFVTGAAETLLSEMPGEPNVLSLLGAAETKKGNYHAAIEHLEAAEGSHLYEAHGIGFHAESMLNLGDTDTALALYNQQLLYQDLTQTREFLALTGIVDVYRTLGEYEAALDAIDVAIAWVPNASHYTLRAEVLMDMGALEDAEVELRIAEHMEPVNNQAAIRTRARLLAAEGNLDEAAGMLIAQRRRNSNRPSYWFQLADIQIQREEFYAAQTILSMIRLRNHETPEKISLRARYLVSIGDVEGAERVLAAALQHNPTNPELNHAALQLGFDL